MRAPHRRIEQQRGDDNRRERAQHGQGRDAWRQREPAVLEQGERESERDGEEDHARNLA